MRWINPLTIMFAILLLAACGPRRAEIEPPRPTITPLPTFTLTPVGAAAAVSSGQVSQPAQSQPVATTAPPTATPTPRPMANVGALMNVRAGPGTNYGIIGTASPGQQFPIIGKNPGLGDWWQIEYAESQAGWVYGPLVTANDAENIRVAAIIPAPPPPTATPIPAPTPVPAPTQPPAPQYPYSVSSTGQCSKNDKVTYFKGFVCQRGAEAKEGCESVGSSPKNDVCVHLAFHGPKQTKCSGCGGESWGAWGFAPFGQADEGETLHDKVRNQPIEIYLVPCPQDLQPGERSSKHSSSGDYSDLTQLSDKWELRLTESTQCTEIIFKER